MILYRLMCAILLAWAVNVSLGRPQAEVFITEVDKMLTIMPISAGLVGYFYLGKRQGKGLVIGLANGAWSGILTTMVAVFMYLTVRMWSNLMHGLIEDFEEFMRILGLEMKPLVETMPNIPMLAVIAGISILAGGATEVLHWCFAYLKRIRRQDEEEIV